MIPPPPVRGIGTGGGFKMMVQDRAGRGLPALEAATQDVVGAANQTPGLAGVFTLFNTRTPQVYADIDRDQGRDARRADRPACSRRCEVYLGSAYVNDFNYPRPHLSGDRAGRRPFRQDVARHRAT